MTRRLLLTSLLLVTFCLSCNEFEDPPPPSPTVPVIPPTQFDITGRWDGVTDQGRPMRFDVRQSGNIVQTKLSLHHDCTGGRLVLQLSGYDAQVNGDAFESTVTWRRDEEGGKWYVGTLTVSGTFEGDGVARGAFVNSITDKQADNLGVCGPTNGSWESTKSK